MSTDTDTRARMLTDPERAAVMAVGALAGGLGLIGFVNSFARVAEAARPWFGVLAPTVPLGVDLGILAFSALDLVLARLDMRPRWLRLIPWALTAATVYLNTTGEPSWFARIAHAVFPLLWVVVVETGAHVIRVRAGLAAGTLMDRIRLSRWFLAPVRTAALWRRMQLWEIRSYPVALERERARLLALTDLQDTYGRWAWRYRAPRRERALYRLGEHPAVYPAAIESAPVPVPDTAPEGVPEPAPESAPGPAPECVPGPRPESAPARTRAPRRPRTRTAPAPRTRGAVSTDDAEREFMPELASGALPSIRVIRTRLHVGQDRARLLRAHLENVSAART